MDNKLEKRIMKRVYGVWFARQIAPVAFVEMPVFSVIALGETAKEFFVARIVENFIASLNSGGFMGIVNFIGNALANAPLLPTAIVGFSVGICLFLAVKLVRNFSQISLVKI